MKLKSYEPPAATAAAGWQLAMREAFFEAVGPDDVRAIVERLVADAKAGDKVAARLVLAYAVGSPTVTVRAKNAVIEVAPLPARPSQALPGTADKVDDMARRVANGQAVFSGKDRKADAS